MEPTATSELLAAGMERPAEEVHDFDKIAEFYWPRVFRFVLASLRDRDAAETLTQECFCKAYKSWHRFRGDASVQTWLMHIAVNLIRDFAKNRRVQFWKRLQSANVGPAAISDWLPARHASPEESALIKEQVDAVWKATALLSEKQRTVFLLRYVEDMDLLEIAAATGMGEGSVKVHLFRALRKVRAVFRKKP